MQPKRKQICLWPDGTWCHIEDIEEFGFLSDDWASRWVPEEWIDEDINLAIDKGDLRV